MKPALQYPPGDNPADQSKAQSDSGHANHMTEDQTKNVCAFGAKRDANSNFAATSGDD